MNPEDLERLVTLRMLRQVRRPDRRPAWPLPQLVRPRGFPDGEIGRLLHLMHEIDHNGLGGLLDPLRHASQA